MSDPHVPAAPPFSLTPLSPEYLEDEHSLYLSALEQALDEYPQVVRNIALSGSYGVGKSSILGELARRRENRVINVSLLTLGVTPEAVPPGGDSNPAARTTSNRIQKEIVKQLLYQQSPRKTALSRFRRIDRPHWTRESLFAIIAGAVVVALLSVSGALAWPGKKLGLDLPHVPAAVQYATALTIAFLLAAGAVVIIRAVLRGRVGIEKVAAGPAAIELSPRSTSYFDEYLDEIVYFFEINPRRDIVIIEDLDRFNDPGIYESLRSLNSILNASQQLGDRDIRFVYAVRDSIFEKLGRPENSTDDTRAELERANRTKFFELIIPVVPFVTHQNAREVMHRVLRTRGHQIDPNLVDVAARHLPDMRTIVNVVNEYEVFRGRLLDGSTPVPGLDATRLFALMLFKNTQAADFEAIRRSESSLDRLYMTWRALVAANIERLEAENERLRARPQREVAEEAHVAQIATRLRAVLDIVSGFSSSGLVSGSLHVNNRVLSVEELNTPSLWQQVADESQQLSVQVANYGQRSAVPLTVANIEGLTGLPLSNDAGVRGSLEAAERKLHQNLARLEFLQRRHTWAQMMRRGDLRYKADDAPLQAFRAWAEQLLPSELAFELVDHGFITSYFPIHVSTFYGTLLPPDAMTYIMRNVDDRVADVDFPLTAADVQAILTNQGRSVLTNPSMRNVSILDEFLESDPAAAEAVLELSPETPSGTQLIHRYLERGRYKDRFVAALAPHWTRMFSYLIQDAQLEPDERAKLTSVAIASRDEDTSYEFGYGIREYMEQNAHEMPAFCEVDTANAASHAIAFVTAVGAVLPDVTELSPHVKVALRETRNYAISARNLQAVSGAATLAMNALKSAVPDVYNYILSNPAEYLAATDSVGSQTMTEDAPGVTEILLDIAHWSSTAIDEFLVRTPSACRVETLNHVPAAAWEALVRYQRTTASFPNVLDYVHNNGTVDEPLAVLMRGAEALGGAEYATEEERVEIAVGVINSPGMALSASDRTRIARTIRQQPLDAQLIEPQKGELIGNLLRAGLLEDDEETFSPRLMGDWPTLEHAILASDAYGDIVGPETLPAQFVGPLLRSDAISSEVKAEVINVFGLWDDLPASAFTAAADCAESGVFSADAGAINRLVVGGISTTQAVRLLADASVRLDTDDLRVILRTMGGDYATVADPGRQRPKLPASDAMRAVLARLTAAGVVSRVTEERGGYLRVNLRHG